MPTIESPEKIVKAVGLMLVDNDINEQVSECDFSKWKIMAGKLDWSAVADSSSFTVWTMYEDGAVYTLVDVRVGAGDHTVDNVGTPRIRVVAPDAILPTVRQFVSCSVTRDRLDVGFMTAEQLGTQITTEPPRMVVRPLTTEVG